MSGQLALGKGEEEQKDCPMSQPLFLIEIYSPNPEAKENFRMPQTTS